MPDSNSAERFVWYELMTVDPEGAKSFYTELIGWGTAPFEGADPPYTMWMKGETPVGGMMELPEQARQAGAPAHWLGYISTPDVEATVERARSLGGDVKVPVTEIPTVGSFAVLADPQGAVFAPFTPSGEGPEMGSPEPGVFSWHELATTDYDGAFRFYSELFGWEKLNAHDMGDGHIYQIFGGAGPPLGGMFNKTAEMPGPPAWLYYVMVDDVGSAAERVSELGGQILNGPMEVPGGDFIAQCMDSQGAAFAIHSTS